MALNVPSRQQVKSWFNRHKVLATALVLVLIAGLVWGGMSVQSASNRENNSTQTASSQTAQAVPADGNYLLHPGATSTLAKEDTEPISVSGQSNGELLAQVTGSTTEVRLQHAWQQMPGGSISVDGKDFNTIARWNPMGNVQIQPSFSGQVAEGTVDGTITIGDTQYPNVRVGSVGGAPTDEVYRGTNELNLVSFGVVEAPTCLATATVAANSGTRVTLLADNGELLAEVEARDGRHFPLIAPLRHADRSLSVGIASPSGDTQVLSLKLQLNSSLLEGCPEQRRR